MRLSLLCIACLLSTPLVLAHSESAHEHAAPKVTAQVDGATVYGVAMPAAPAAVAVQDVLARPTDFLEGDIKISGRIGGVCQKAGCWLSLLAGDQQLRVMFGNHDFTIPTDSNGHAEVYGKLQQVTLSEEKARHMAEDAGVDPATISGEQIEYRVVATSVSIRS